MLGRMTSFRTSVAETMNGGTPWRGPREKARAFMQMVVEALSAPGDVIMDCTVGTGTLWSYLICSTSNVPEMFGI